VKLKSASDPDPFVAKHIRLMRVECNTSLEPEMNTTFEGIEENQYIKSYFNLTSYTKVPIEANKTYYLCLESCIPFPF
jgi:hypothetical protein